MTKTYTFSTKSYPTNDLLALDLQAHMDDMAKFGWELISTQHLFNERRSVTPQLMLFWVKG